MELKFFDTRKMLTAEETYRELYYIARDTLVKKNVYSSKGAAHISMVRKIPKEFIAAKLPKRATEGKLYKKKNI